MINHLTKHHAICLVLVNVVLFSCTSKTKEKIDEIQNPLVQKSILQYQAPQFDLIKDEDFVPAFKEGLKIHDSEIDAITNNTEAPTFENTVLALELSGEVLDRATNVFYNLTGSSTNPTLQAIEKEYAPIFSSHSDNIYLNSKIYNRIKALDLSTLKGEDLKLVDYYLKRFEMAGASLSSEDKEKMMEINKKLSVLKTEFNSRLLKARKEAALVVDTVEELDGLSSDDIERAKLKAEEAGLEGKYVLGLSNTTQQPLLAVLKNRETRRKLFEASFTRAEKNNAADTRQVVEEIALLRMQKAQLMGKKNYAEWKLQNQMAKTPDRALNLLSELGKASVAQAKKEAANIQSIIDAQNGGFKLEPWDWSFYAEQVKKAKYDLDQKELEPYFELNSVLENGVFYAAERMYGITFKKRTDLPVYNPDVITYEVFDKDGSSLALYYLDFYTRDTKKGGAWMNSFVNQSHYLKQKPVIVNVFNYIKPTEGNPSLISFDNVTTMFHEFGHTLHGLFANQQYVSLSGTSVPRDYVEFPSQINEHAALEPDVLKNYAIHYETKEAIPQALIDKLMKAEMFNKGYDVTELLAASVIDMMWHTVENEADFKSVLEFEKEALAKNGLLVSEVPSRYHTPYFAHVWGSGYSAGYYAYTWSKTLDYNTYDWIKANGGMNRENGERFRKHILSVGNSVDLNKAFTDFVGHDMEVDAYINNVGF
ncbi:M3 family metallopeptidase [Algibacter lectus]|uniref:Dipeptidyl carboxypeptidase n=1 Tax=Algibacter lectus TaxID=221126 RepID=A0A4R8MCH8_9FLAO|nr:M3 family metallopeptidase [Algibacter lectus]MWW23967.1 dipeptidyl carboxypeptidase II [Algibacter lectus]TDY61982.1 peptidyl-dipeptidase Dcp [Algibacter lectus]